MEAISKMRFIRLEQKKGRLPVDLIKGKTVEEALAILKNLPNKSAKLIYKAVKSAYSNLTIKEPTLKENEAIVKSVFIERGPVMKRVMPRARGRADVIKKRLSHIKVIVEKINL